MYIQDLIQIFFLSLVGLFIIFIGTFAWATSKKPKENIKTNGGVLDGNGSGMHRDEKAWLIFLIILAIIGNAFLLSPILLPAKIAIWKGVEPTKVVTITVEEYKFYLPENPIKLKKGEVVEFLVKSNDVTHGFGVFRKDGSMVFQIQVLPNYNNKIVWVFDEPGLYTIRCTEYCGPRHPEMVVYNAILVEAGE
jgi:cytochrome c oxidase subunit 2